MANISKFWPVAHLFQAASHRSEFPYNKRSELFKKKKIVTGYYQFLVYFPPQSFTVSYRLCPLWGKQRKRRWSRNRREGNAPSSLHFCNVCLLWLSQRGYQEGTESLLSRDSHLWISTSVTTPVALSKLLNSPSLSFSLATSEYLPTLQDPGTVLWFPFFTGSSGHQERKNALS